MQDHIPQTQEALNSKKDKSKNFCVEAKVSRDAQTGEPTFNGQT